MQLVPNTETVPASVNRFLLPHERQVLTARYHPAVLMGPVGLTVAGLVAAAVAGGISRLSSDALLIMWLAWGLFFLYTITRISKWFAEYFIVTTQRVMVVKGFFTRDVICMPLATAGSMKFRRTTMGRLLGYGQFVVEAERVQPMWVINFLPYPEQLYLEVMGLIYRDADTNTDTGRDPASRLPLEDLLTKPPEWMTDQNKVTRSAACGAAWRRGISRIRRLG